MYPVCLKTIVLVATGMSSTGSLTALVITGCGKTQFALKSHGDLGNGVDKNCSRMLKKAV